MSPQLISAIVFITIALILYVKGFYLSIKKKYPNSFWYFLIGWLVFDIPGTIIMYIIAGEIKFNWHTIPGMIGFILMAAAAILALFQITKFRESLMKWFKPIETTGVIIWTFSYVVGAVIRIPFISNFIIKGSIIYVSLFFYKKNN